MDWSLELLIVPDALVCAMFHFNLAHNATAVPIGFISSAPEHITSAGTHECKSARTALPRDARRAVQRWWNI